MLRSTLLFFLTVNFAVNAMGQLNKKYRILTYGLPNLTRNSAREIVGNKWDIQFYSVAGCVIDQRLKDSVEKENQLTYALLASKYGNNWSDRFYSEIDKEFTLQIEITKFVDSLSFIKKRNIGKFSPDAGYKMHPLNDKKTYIVNVEGWGEWGGQPAKEVYYTLQVNYDKKLVKILNYKTIKAK